MRKRNLHDTQRAGFPEPSPKLGAEAFRHQRTPDGSYNDMAEPMMGATGMRFGRNTPIKDIPRYDENEIMDPSPREISRRLLARRNGEFHGVPFLNVLAAAWLQFQTHDWFGHESDPDNPRTIPLEDSDDWPNADRPMKIDATKPDAKTGHDNGMPDAFVNTESHWWDSSHVYGRTAQRQSELRAGQNGKLKIKEGGRLPLEDNGLELTGVNNNWWVGLSLLHTLFANEHNAICDHLIAAHPSKVGDDEWLFQKARLVNCALIAKIHTVEWTPAVLNNPTLRFSMRGNWWGVLGEELYRSRGRFTSGELLQGILGSETDHHAAPYSLTEEFVAVYRMHPLLPDEYNFRTLADNKPIDTVERLNFRDVAGRRTAPLYDKMTLSDAAYSLGTRNPGQIRLRNYPAGLMRFERQDETVGASSGEFMDLGTIDVLRDRERGIPKYNDFRRMLGMKPAKRIRDICSNREWTNEIEDIYGGDVEKVDAIVGLLAEDLPKGFAFSDTAFRIFILMASRRLKSDRFFTTDYTAATYTQAGLDWIDKSYMTDVILRHWPDLEPSMRGVKNAFFIWRETKPQ